ncbi:HAMP domain-containing histidine kinase [Mucilaginibacter daejeonensis]|uniref:sensor histidine kinase n=1 Tax=Mucilaginibacter daejeonensis TaxID=398049 RepID=UPI001D171A93|nr:HAMP domain-containing sensor histidine kinase [Mucilaginibacter daejeonensis]UEG54100.1 HAMP domain-containing histidine kinase [Mucilaginibacter daejeonensis]
MNLKQRFSLIFSCLFSVVLAVVMLVVYWLFADFRQEEFVDRLAEKAETTARILLDVKEVTPATQKMVDENSITRLYSEKVQVFDTNKKLIYRSADNADVRWTNAELDQVKKEGRVFKTYKEFEVLGVFYTSQKKDNYVLISATDTYGNRKLVYLKYLLLGAFITGTLLVWLLSFWLSKKSLEPLDIFRKQIQEIADNELTIRLPKAKREDEINALARSFNQMMDRIDQAYARQREFTANASHELRTPVARIALQTENMMQTADLDDATRAYLSSVADDAFKLSEIITSLISFAEVNNRRTMVDFKPLRLDEVVFGASAELSVLYPDLKLKFEIENTTTKETDIEISADEVLLKIVMLNLIKNAYLYSDNKVVECCIKQKEHTIDVIITNTGPVPQLADTAQLFNTFYRGTNTNSRSGTGIGLSIVKRVLDYHQANILFNIIDSNTNQVIVTFVL